MALSSESLPYITDAMGSTASGQELINAIQTPATLGPIATTRLITLFGENDIAANFQKAILGTYVLTSRDTDFIKCGFSAPLTVLASILDNLVVGSPTFSPPGESHTGAVNVTLSSMTPGAKIHYTTDGSTPTASSTLYTAPIAVAATETIKAIAVTTGTHNSPVVSATYTIS